VLTATGFIKRALHLLLKQVVQSKERKKSVEQVLGAILEGLLENFIKTHQIWLGKKKKIQT